VGGRGAEGPFAQVAPTAVEEQRNLGQESGQQGAGRSVLELANPTPPHQGGWGGREVSSGGCEQHAGGMGGWNGAASFAPP